MLDQSVETQIVFKANILESHVMFCCLGNVELVNRLLLDAGITSELVKNWKDNEFQ